MEDIICPKCFKKFDRKSNLYRHLNKITPCNKNTMHYQNLQDPEKLKKFIQKYFPNNPSALSKISSKKYTCDFCNKSFSNSSYFKKHTEELCSSNIQFEQDIIKYKLRKINKIKNENNLLKEKIYESLKTLPRYTIENSKIITIEKDYTHYYQQKNIRPFGEEITNHLTPKFMRKMIINPEVGLVNLVRIIHFNPSIKPNRNIFIKARKFNFVEVYQKKGWATLQRKDAFQNIIATKKDIMDEWFDTLCEQNSLKDKYISKYENFSHGLDRYINHLVFNTDFNNSLKLPKITYEKISKMINLLFLNNKQIEITYTPENNIFIQNPPKKNEYNFPIFNIEDAEKDNPSDDENQEPNFINNSPKKNNFNNDDDDELTLQIEEINNNDDDDDEPPEPIIRKI